MDNELDDVMTVTSPTLIEAEKSDEQKEVEEKESKKLFEVAALAKHPGWKQVRKMMADDIDNVLRLRDVNLKQYDNAQLGEVVRVEHMLAEKLQKYLAKVDDAVKAVSDGREK
jgi:hypothetical protein